MDRKATPATTETRGAASGGGGALRGSALASWDCPAAVLRPPPWRSDHVLEQPSLVYEAAMFGPLRHTG